MSLNAQSGDRSPAAIKVTPATHMIHPEGLPSDLRDAYLDRFSDLDLPLEQLVDIEHPAFWVNPYPVYERLQQEAPAYFYEPLNTWILTRFEDVKRAARSHDTFSCQHGILLYDGKEQDNGLGKLFAGDGDMIGLTDPPRHGELRRVMQPPFVPASLDKLATRLDLFCNEMLDAITPGEPIEWVSAVAERLPMVVMAAILGIPDQDEEFFDQVRVWTEATEALSARKLDDEERAEVMTTFAGLGDFISDVFEHKRRHPGDDFLTSLLADHIYEQELSQKNLVGFVQLLIAAGGDTTRSLLSNLIAHLAVDEHARALLRTDESLVANAVEEALRIAPPRGFARQLVQDTEFAGVAMKDGQRVFLCYDAANRDPSVFENPHAFDVTRTSNRRNVGFGFGAHVCIAAPLVRLETKILLTKLVERYPDFVLAGPGRRVVNFLRNGWDELPVVFEGAR